jgi:translin
MTSGSPPSDDPAPVTHGRVPEPALVAIETHLRHRESRRDELHQRARRLRRLAQGTMGQIHEGKDVRAALAEVQASSKELAEWLRTDGRGDEGLAHDALQESAEALLLGAVVHGGPLPGPPELGLEPEPYLMGLGDLVGEVRRLALDRLRHGDLEGAEGYVATMEHLFRALMRFDTTRAIVALKPKQDVARSLLERTRGEVTMARVMSGRIVPPGDRT